MYEHDEHATHSITESLYHGAWESKVNKSSQAKRNCGEQTAVRSATASGQVAGVEAGALALGRSKSDAGGKERLSLPDSRESDSWSFGL